MSRQPILQQYYTRGRQGIFRSNEGYDTVAISPGLDHTFIKKTLHPFCVYDTPRELQERGETNPELYPEALVCFQAESGEMVLGRSVFVGADFTGQRNTFFSHNFVIPRERREEFIKDPAKIFGVPAFRSHHKETAGKELLQLEDIPVGAGLTGDRKQRLQQMGIDGRLFKQLLYAVGQSLSGKKKVFISLHVDVSQSAEAARQLLEILYGCLPYEMRRHFGFLTYSNEPANKKHIHVMFVEKGSIRPGSGHSEKDFLFDFVHGRIHNVELQEGANEYLDYAWEYLNEPSVLASFHAFCDEVLEGAELSKRLRVSTYRELCALYLIEKGRMSGYERNRAAIWQVLIDYLRQDGLVNKSRLHDLLKVLFDEERNALAAKKLTDSEIVGLIIESCSVTKKEGYQTEIVKYAIDVLLKGKASHRSDYVTSVYNYLSSNRELFGFLMKTIFGYKQAIGPLFDDYLEQRLKNASTIRQVLQEIEFWAATAPQALRHPFFAAASTQKLLSLITGESHKLEAAMQIHHFFEEWEGTRSFSDELLDEVDKLLLKQINLEALSGEDVGTIRDLLEDKPKTFFGGLGLESRKKLELCLHLGSLEEQTVIPEPENFFRRWDPEDVEVQQRLILKMLGDSLDSECFPKIALIFFNTDARGFRFTEMLAFVHRRGGEETVLSYIQWTLTQKMFVEGKYMTPAYRQALKQFFRENKGRRLRDKQWRKRWLATRNADFRKMLEEVRSETANPLLKLFRQKRFVIGLGSIVTAGVVSGFLLMGQNSVGTQQIQKPEKGAVVPVYQLMIDPEIKPVGASSNVGPHMNSANP